MCTRKGINDNTPYIHMEENNGLELGIIPHTRCMSGCTSLTLNHLIRQTPLLGIGFHIQLIDLYAKGGMMWDLEK
jgi:hypothetical protein